MLIVEVIFVSMVNVLLHVRSAEVYTVNMAVQNTNVKNAMVLHYVLTVFPNIVVRNVEVHKFANMVKYGAGVKNVEVHKFANME